MLSPIISFAADLYIIIVISRVILSWIPHNPQQPVFLLIYQITEPPLEWIRKWLPSFAGLDLSPIVLIVAIKILVLILL